MINTRKIKCPMWTGVLSLEGILKRGLLHVHTVCDHQYTVFYPVQTAEFEQILSWCVEALCVLRCPEMIQGFYVWSRDILGRKLTWMKAAIEMASGR